MRVLAVAHSKGGVGKSSLTFALALEAARAGRRVLVVDTDAPQGTLGLFVAARGDREPRLALVSTHDPLTDVPPLADRYDVALIDAGGRDTGTLRRALATADTVLLPCRPSPADLWSLSDVFDVTTALAEVRPVRVVVALVQVPVGNIGDEARELVAGELRPGVELARTSIASRVSWARALASGLSPAELEPGGHAADELQHLARELKLTGRG